MRSSNMKDPHPEKGPDVLKVLFFPKEGLLQGRLVRESGEGKRRPPTICLMRL